MADDIFSEDELKALETAETAASEPVVEAPEAPAEPEQPRDPETGKFLPKEPAEPEAQPEVEEPRDNKVPQGALHAERERRKDAEGRAKTFESELKAAREQLQEIARLREQVKASKAPTSEAPTDDTGLQHLTERLSQVEQVQHTTQQQRDEAALQAAEDEQLRVVAQAADTAYRQQVPDYDDAVRHLIQARGRELGRYGYSMPQIENAIGNEARDIIRTAIQRGQDPADLIYQIAQDRGYRPGAPEQPSGGGQAQRQIEAVGAARSQSRSLGQAAGATPNQLNGDALKAMSDDEFGELYATAEGRKLIDAIMQGRA